MDDIVVGIDIGGSHLTSAITDLETGAIVTDTLYRGQVDSQGSPKSIIDQWCSTINKTLSGYRNKSVRVGIAIPGPFRYEEGISEMQNQDKYDALYGLNVKEMLAEALGLPLANIEFFNDAECFLRGEAFAGAVKGYRRSMGLTLGTGLGTAWYRDGEARDADLWRYPLKDGIAEDYISTRWFVKRYFELTGANIENVRELAELGHNDTHALQIWAEFAANLGFFLQQVAPQFEPQAVVIGGNIARSFNLFYPALEAVLSGAGLHIDVHRTKLGEEAALIGAAAVWNSRIHEANHTNNTTSRRE